MSRKLGKVLVAMSGGVDSSVCAYLLKEQGYEIVGAHMKLWDYVDVGGDIYKDGRCCTIDSITDCRFVCDALDAPFYVLNFSEQFSKHVIEDFVSEYRNGRTPNPCVKCNTEVKWKAFLNKAKELNCDYIATGHYAFVEKNDFDRWQVRCGVDETRDQSYFLWGLSQEALSKTLMPLGSLRKSEVRKIARLHNLRTADKSESREICFVADNDYRRFLVEHEEKKTRAFEPGEIVHVNGEVLGSHSGTAFFTVGQRKGLGVSYATPLYVHKIDIELNRVVVGENDSLFMNSLKADSINWVSRIPNGNQFNATVKIRYTHSAAAAKVERVDEAEVNVVFEEPQRAITAGQTVVLYDNDILLAGGIIQSAG